MQVLHQVEQHCFVIEAEGAAARLEYRLLQLQGRNVVDFYHTFVPPALRGRGIAAVLTEAALAWATAQSLQVQASCSYVARYL